MIRYRAAVVATAVLGLLVVSGCGPSAPTFVKVQGKITMDGQPIDGAVVTYIPVGGKGEQASGRTSSDGVYQLTTRNTGDGALAGETLNL